MASEIQFSYMTGKTCYFLIRNKVGQIWNNTTLSFEAYSTSNYGNYVISVSEQGTASSYYAGNFPSGIVAGAYNIVSKSQVGGSPLETDATIALGDYQWNGTTTLPLSDLATSGQIGRSLPIKMTKGQMVLPFPFKLVSSLDGKTGFTSGVVSGQISKDGGIFGVLQSGSFSEMGLGWYKLQALTSGDMNASVIALQFTATGVSGGVSDPRDFLIVTQSISG